MKKHFLVQTIDQQTTSLLFNPLTLKSDLHVTSPHNIHTLFSKQVMRIFRLIR